MRKCPRCGEEKEENKFSNKNNKWCRKCSTEYHNDWERKNRNKANKNKKRCREKNIHKARKKERDRYQKHKNEKRKYQRNYYAKNKLELVKFMGGKCLKCDLTPEDVNGCLGVFVVDEVEPLGIKGKKFSNLSKKDLMFAKRLFREGKTQLLCQNCSAVKTWKNGDCCWSD